MARFESTTVGSSDVPAATLPRTGGGRSTRRGADARGRTSHTARDPCLRRSRRRASFGERGRSDKNVSLEGWALYTCFAERIDRKSTRLNSSHVKISYAVFCLKKKKKKKTKIIK